MNNFRITELRQYLTEYCHHFFFIFGILQFGLIYSYANTHTGMKYLTNALKKVCCSHGTTQMVGEAMLYNDEPFLVKFWTEQNTNFSWCTQ